MTSNLLLPDDFHQMPLNYCTTCDGVGRVQLLELLCFKNSEETDALCEGCAGECFKENTKECKNCDGTGEVEPINPFDNN